MNEATYKEGTFYTVEKNRFGCYRPETIPGRIDAQEVFANCMPGDENAVQYFVSEISKRAGCSVMFHEIVSNERLELIEKTTSPYWTKGAILSLLLLHIDGYRMTDIIDAFARYDEKYLNITEKYFDLNISVNSTAYAKLIGVDSRTARQWFEYIAPRDKEISRLVDEIKSKSKGALLPSNMFLFYPHKSKLKSGHLTRPRLRRPQNADTLFSSHISIRLVHMRYVGKIESHEILAERISAYTDNSVDAGDVSAFFTKTLSERARQVLGIRLSNENVEWTHTLHESIANFMHSDQDASLTTVAKQVGVNRNMLIGATRRESALIKKQYEDLPNEHWLVYYLLAHMTAVPEADRLKRARVIAKCLIERDSRSTK